MCKEDEVGKIGKKEGSQEKFKGKDRFEKGQDKLKTEGNGWRDILDELDYSNGPGDNIYVFG